MPAVSMFGKRKDIWSLATEPHTLLAGIYCSCLVWFSRLLLLWFQTWVTAIISKAACRAACLNLPCPQGFCREVQYVLIRTHKPLYTLLSSSSERDVFLDWGKGHHSLFLSKELGSSRQRTHMASSYFCFLLCHGTLLRHEPRISAWMGEGKWGSYLV